MVVVGKGLGQLETHHDRLYLSLQSLAWQGAHMHCRNMRHWYHSSPATSAAVSKGLFFSPRIADIRQPTASQSSTLMFGFKQLTHQQMQHTMHA
jgi:hypothetical protein